MEKGSSVCTVCVWMGGDLLGANVVIVPAGARDGGLDSWSAKLGGGGVSEWGERAQLGDVVAMVSMMGLKEVMLTDLSCCGLTRLCVRRVEHASYLHKLINLIFPCRHRVTRYL